jgi:hypothetical protein
VKVRRKKSRGLKRFGRVASAILAAAFGYTAYIYLTLPDVRPLRTTIPKTTAFMELRVREAHAHGEPVVQ